MNEIEIFQKQSEESTTKSLCWCSGVFSVQVMEKMEEGERSGGEEEAELLMVCDEEELEVFPQETKGGDNRDETNKPGKTTHTRS